MLINLSNHPSSKWSVKQSKTAIKKYRQIFDLPFPHISPNATSNQVKKSAETYLKKCLQVQKNNFDKNFAVHVMGELTFTFYIVTLLRSKNIKCIASTTKRIVKESNSSKTSIFSFVKFREY